MSLTLILAVTWTLLNQILHGEAGGFTACSLCHVSLGFLGQHPAVVRDAFRTLLVQLYPGPFFGRFPDLSRCAAIAEWHGVCRGLRDDFAQRFGGGTLCPGIPVGCGFLGSGRWDFGGKGCRNSWIIIDAMDPWYTIHYTIYMDPWHQWWSTI